MKITDLLNEQTICIDVKSTTKNGVIDELVNLLYKAGNINNSKKFKKAILAREKQVSTGIGDFVAIPHAKNKAVLKPGLAFGLSREGIDYESIDGKPSHIFFMIAAPEKGNDLHLDALSKLARMLIHEDFRLGLLGATTPEDVLALIDTKESE